ncbi:transporter [Sphingomonas profundi]|uniref:transporter n=1 Tax=Alterirhizorhabdus profundi TaxID=2681549 RepID=UPI0012E71488|nr:transporter [Sphingomonas profundi]
MNRALRPLTAAVLTILAGVAPAGAAGAQELRDLCAQRPGLGTAPCTVDAGHLQIELGLGDWTLDRQPDTRTDTILAGDVLARYGLTGSLEAQVGWTAFGHVRERDRATGDVRRRARTGDVLLALKQSLASPDGSGFSVAALPFVTVPVGRAPVGAGDWGAGFLLPVSYEVSDAIQIQFTPEIDAAVDEDGNGRHLAFSGVIGATDKVSDAVSATLEYQALRDRDPGGHRTPQLVGLSAAWLARKQFQLDVGTNLRLNHAAADVEVYFGLTRKF